MSIEVIFLSASDDALKKKFRTDIQALRGFAVLIVLFYHAKIGPLTAGFLGVDVFFVISGYLITSLVRDSIERGDFSFSTFYFRRAKRILPAAYVTFLASALLAPFFLASSELNDLRSQMVGAVTFVSNVVLWRQSGYFEGAATLKPLLHVWSLSIEEQYYFILPALMFFIPRRFWKIGAAVLLMVSLALCLYMVQRMAGPTFYLLPTRGWELAIGSFGALILVGARLEKLLTFAFWPALAILLTLPIVKISHYHPGPDALLICLATLVIILRKHPYLYRGALITSFSWIGNISYSLYLVHWPLFAFLNNSWFGGMVNAGPPVSIRLGIMVLSLFLAWMMNRYIEEPIRRMDVKLTRNVFLSTVAASLALVMISLGITHAVATQKDYAHILRPNMGISKDCSFNPGTDFEPIAECRNSDQPRFLIWGDSFAIHLVPGILGEKGGPPPIIQAARSNCGPMLGVAPFLGDKDWPKYCVDFNDSVMTYLSMSESVKIVVLSSPFTAYVDLNKKLVKVDSKDKSLSVVDAGLHESVAALKKTVEKIRGLGKRVVIIAPPPTNGISTGRCIERLENNLPVLGVDGECREITLDSWEKARWPVLEFLATLPAQADVEVIYPSDYLCGSGKCQTIIDGTIIYQDSQHFSYGGSVLLANKMGLIERIEDAAR